jgi:hypothetical protein
MIIKTELLYGGKNVIDIRDKETKELTGEQQYIYTLLEIDKSKNVVVSAQYFLKNDLKTDDFQLLKPVIAEIDLSLDNKNTFRTLVNLEKKC